MLKANKQDIINILNNPDNKKYTNQYSIDFKVKRINSGDYLIIDSTEYDVTMGYAKIEAVDFINNYWILEDKAEELPTLEPKDDKHLQVKVGVCNFA